MRRIGIVALGIIVGAFVVAGCGGSDSDSEGDAAESNSDPITVAFTAPLSGGLSAGGQDWVDTARVWARQVNQDGGLLGRDVEVVYEDDKSDPETAAQLYTRFITQDKVDFVIGPFSTGITQRVAPIAERYQKLFLVSGATSSVIWEEGYEFVFFASNFPGAEVHQVRMDWIESLPEPEQPETAAYIRLDAVATETEIEAARKLAEELGIETVLNDTYAESVVDFGAIAAKLEAVDADMVVQSGYNETIPFAKAFCASSADPMYLTTSVAVVSKSEYPGQVGPACAEGTSFSTFWDPSMPDPASQEFVSTWEDTVPKNEEPDAINGCEYSGLQILQTAVEEVGSLDQQALRDYVADNTFDTVCGEIGFREDGYAREAGGIVAQWQDGERVVLWPEDVATGEGELRNE